VKKLDPADTEWLNDTEVWYSLRLTKMKVKRKTRDVLKNVNYISDEALPGVQVYILTCSNVR
jgi:hypothetical protein